MVQHSSMMNNSKMSIGPGLLLNAPPGLEDMLPCNVARASSNAAPQVVSARHAPVALQQEFGANQWTDAIGSALPHLSEEGVRGALTILNAAIVNMAQAKGAEKLLAALPQGSQSLRDAEQVAAEAHARQEVLLQQFFDLQRAEQATAAALATADPTGAQGVLQEQRERKQQQRKQPQRQQQQQQQQDVRGQMHMQHQAAPVPLPFPSGSPNATVGAPCRHGAGEITIGWQQANPFHVQLRASVSSSHSPMPSRQGSKESTTSWDTTYATEFADDWGAVTESCRGITNSEMECNGMEAFESRQPAPSQTMPPALATQRVEAKCTEHGKKTKRQETHVPHTLSASLLAVENVDERLIVVVRRIHKLGFQAEKSLRKHFGQFGRVLRIFLAHSTARSHSGGPPQVRSRPSNLGFLQFASAKEVKAILARGEEQQIGAASILVQRFSRKADNVDVEDLAPETERASTTESSVSINHDDIVWRRMSTADSSFSVDNEDIVWNRLSTTESSASTCRGDMAWRRASTTESSTDLSWNRGCSHCSAMTVSTSASGRTSDSVSCSGDGSED